MSELKDQIELMRSKMNSLAEKYNELQHPEVIQASEELDKLINEAMQAK
ncbi:aspartyl-phosphate phosphatase Spo0E family protein [Paenibacillus algorifonticola]